MTKKTRKQLLNETALTTPVAGMRTGWGLLSSYWKSEERFKAYGMAGTLAGLTLAHVFLNAQFALWFSNTYEAFIRKDPTAIAAQLALFGGKAYASARINRTRDFTGRKLNISWRGWLTRQFTDAVTSKKAFLHLGRAPKTVDNPDQRISDDPDKMTAHLTGLTMGAFETLLSLPTFTMIMYNKSDKIPVDFMNSTWNMPGIQFWIGFGAAMACSAIGARIIHKIVDPLSKLTEQQMAKEGRFRHSLISLFKRSAEIASYDSRKAEREILNKNLQAVQDNDIQLSWAQANYMYRTNIYNHASNGLKAGVVLSSWALSKEVTLGAALTIGDAFDRLRGSMSWPIYSFAAIAEVKTMMRRMMAAAKDIEDSQTPQTIYERDGLQAEIKNDKVPRNTILIRDLVLKAEDSKILLTIDRLEFKEGEHILIDGESGCGKTTLLMAITDQWKYGSGQVLIPASKKMFYASQRPLVKGDLTLKQNIIYPHLDKDVRDEDVTEALRAAHLEHYIPHLNEQREPDKSWEMMSQGEQQRLVFARLFLAKPDIVILDEATSAMDEKLQDEMYRTLIERQPKATIISIAHRREVMQFHNRYLRIDDSNMYDGCVFLQSRKPTNGISPI